MNYVDIVLGAILVFAGYKGFKKGFIIEVLSLAALFLGVWGGIHLSDEAAIYLNDSMQLKEEYLPMVSFAVVFLIIVILVNLLARTVSKMIDLVALGFVNKLAGAVFSVLKAGLILSFVLMIARPFTEPMNLPPRDLREGSLLYGPLITLAPTVVPMIKDSEAWKYLEENGWLDFSPNDDSVPEEGITL